MAAIGIDLDTVRRTAEEAFGPGALQDPPEALRWSRRRRPHRGGHIPFSQRAKTALELSLRESLRLRHNYIGAEHILLGVLRESGGLAVRLLAELGADPVRVRDQLTTRIQRSA